MEMVNSANGKLLQLPGAEMMPVNKSRLCKASMFTEWTRAVHTVGGALPDFAGKTYGEAKAAAHTYQVF